MLSCAGPITRLAGLFHWVRLALMHRATMKGLRHSHYIQLRHLQAPTRPTHVEVHAVPAHVTQHQNRPAAVAAGLHLDTH